VAPKNRRELQRVVCNTGQNGWSLAEGFRDGEPALAIRWNGDDDSGSPGNPQSHGQPTSFIVPDELRPAVMEVVGSLDAAMSYIDCAITRPKGYQWGVFCVEITLQGKILDAIGSTEPTFPVPKLPDRLVRPDNDFLAPPLAGENRLRGKFKSGQWLGSLQTNGIDEDSNRTPIAIVRH
jgi:hypothetical protein